MCSLTSGFTLAGTPEIATVAAGVAFGAAGAAAAGAFFAGALAAVAACVTSVVEVGSTALTFRTLSLRLRSEGIGRDRRFGS